MRHSSCGPWGRSLVAGPAGSSRSGGSTESTWSAGEQARRLLARHHRLREVHQLRRDLAPRALHRLTPETARPVRRADQGARHDTQEAEALGLADQRHELLGLHPTVDRVVPHRGSQVLGDRQEFATGLVQVADRVHGLLGRLAHPEDEVGLRHQAVVAREREDGQRTVVPERWLDPLEDPRHGLEVVREHLRPGAEHLRELLGDGVEVRDEELDAGAGVEGVDLVHGLGVEPGPAVGQVVARDAGHGRVAQAHGANRLGDPPRLVGVEVGGLAGVDLTEVTAAGALVTADQEGCLAVFPAFEDVGAAGLLAHRVQATVTDDALELVVLRPHRRAGPDPLGLALDGRLRVTGLDPQHPSTLWCDRHALSLAMCGFKRTPARVAARTPFSASERCAHVSLSTSAIVTSRPSSALSEVTSASEIPHGTMRPNWSRSTLQFSAKPCIVTPFAMRTPIAATLRSRRVSSAGSQTPLRSATLIASRPRPAHRSMIDCSSARTYRTTSIGSASRTIG